MGLLNRRSVFLLLLCTGLPGSLLAQGWREQCGYLEWQMLTGLSPSTLGTGVTASMVEARVSESGPYLPEGTSGTGTYSGTGDFSGKTFDPKSGATATSWHAAIVGGRYYGNSASGAPGVSTVLCWEANNYVSSVLGSFNAGTSAVSAKTQSNAWIAYSAPENENTYADLVRRFDYLTATNGMVTAVGLNNGSWTTVPMLMNASYNGISCGLSNGEHSRGGTLAGPSGSDITAGRLRPLVVIPESATSWSTGAVAGMASALSAHAVSLGGNANDSRVLRAVIFSGATKHEFPSWSRSETQPVDAVYGAGECNLLHSWRILTAGNQPNAGTGTASSRGWSRPSVGPNTQINSRSYSIALPASGSAVSFIATACWNRPVSSFPTFSYDPLPFVTLELYDSSNVLLQRSASTLDNLQHLYIPNLTPGQTVTLRLTSDTNSTVIGLAWRADPVMNAATQVTSSMGPVGHLQFNGLLNGAKCRVERSTDLASWSGVHDFTASGTIESWNDPAPPATPVFYRLRYFSP